MFSGLNGEATCRLSFRALRGRVSRRYGRRRTLREKQLALLVLVLCSPKLRLLQLR